MSIEISGNGRKQLAALSAPRCRFIKCDGTSCGSPALKNRAFCYFHSRTPDGRKRKTSNTTKPTLCEVPVLKDDNAIRVAVSNVCRSLANKTLDSRRASTMLYGLQIASAALRRSRFAAQDGDGITICADHGDAITR